MKILISTGIYPPAVGGPATYAKNLNDVLLARGDKVEVLTFGFEKKLPLGVRHVFYFCRVLFAMVVFRPEVTLVFDTFTVGVPTVLAGLVARRATVVRVSGDFLWEAWVERTHETVPLNEFYNSTRDLTFKERIIRQLSSWALRHTSGLVFQNAWIRDIYVPAYGLKKVPTIVIENFYGPKRLSLEPHDKKFMWAVRPIFLKNGAMLARAMQKAQQTDSTIGLDTELSSHEILLARISKCYAVILPSLADINPNFVTEAVQYGKPFICTKNTGLYDKLKDVGIFVDPLSEEDITRAILTLADPVSYAEYRKRALAYNFVHTYDDIANEFIAFAQSINK